jgi:hypothetical protein
MGCWGLGMDTNGIQSQRGGLMVGGPRPKPTMLTRRTLLAATPVAAVGASAALRPADPLLPRAIGRYLGPNCSPPLPDGGAMTGYSSARLHSVAGSGIHVGGNPLAHHHTLRPAVGADGESLGSVPGHNLDDGTSGTPNLGRSPALILTTAGIFEG